MSLPSLLRWIMAVTADLDITVEVIAEGTPKSPVACPVAIALRASGADQPTKAGSKYAYSTGYARVEWSADVKQWIADYNAGLPVSPIAFSITFT